MLRLDERERKEHINYLLSIAVHLDSTSLLSILWATLSCWKGQRVFQILEPLIKDMSPDELKEIQHGALDFLQESAKDHPAFEEDE